MEGTMEIQYCGTKQGMQTFAKLLNKFATITESSNTKNAVIFELATLDDLYNISSRTFDVPTFFYITTPNKALISGIKDYSVSGVFTPPLQAETVISKIQRAVSSQLQQSNSQDFDMLRIKIIAKAENIPSLPSVAQDIIKLASDTEKGSIGTITSKIKTDQGLSSKVIRLVNSPFYGVRTEIASIDRAIALLGFASIKNIALAISIEQYFQQPFHMYKTNGQALWQHAYNVALIASAIAKYTGLDEEALYMAGLLHDIGKVVLAEFLVQEVDSIQDERKQIGCDHSEIAAVILKKWAVAPSIVEAVRTYHSESPTPEGKVIMAASYIDHNKQNLDIAFEEGLKDFHIKDRESLVNSIKSLIGESNEEQ